MNSQKGRRSDYSVSVSMGGKLLATLSVSSQSVSEALKDAYLKNCSWQMIPPENLEQLKLDGM